MARGQATVFTVHAFHGVWDVCVCVFRGLEVEADWKGDGLLLIKLAA